MHTDCRGPRAELAASALTVTTGLTASASSIAVAKVQHVGKQLLQLADRFCWFLHLLQDLAHYLKVEELNSTANFPSAMEQFSSTLSKVEACSATRALVEGDTAVLCASIKAGGGHVARDALAGCCGVVQDSMLSLM